MIRRLAKDSGDDGNQAARKALQALLDQPRTLLSGDMDHRPACDLYADRTDISFTDAVVAVSDAAFDKSEPVAFDDGVWRARSAAHRDK